MQAHRSARRCLGFSALNRCEGQEIQFLRSHQDDFKGVVRFFGFLDIISVIVLVLSWPRESLAGSLHGKSRVCRLK